MLSHPLVIEINAFTPFELILVGDMSPYVSSFDKITLTADFPSSTSFSRFGRSLYASGPTTISTIFSSSKNLCFNLSAIHPNTPTFTFEFFRLTLLNFSNLFLTVSSAFSLIEHVLTNIKSAKYISFVVLYPFSERIDATISLSLKFMAQP